MAALITREHVTYSFDKRNCPVARVNQGEPVIFEMLDGFGGQIKRESQVISEINWSGVNPATGPVHINDSGAGDTLAIRILNLKLARQGVYVVAKNLGVLGSLVKSPSTHIARVSGNHFSIGKTRLELRPNIGVIGVAPRSGSISCGVPGDHGGNLDTSLIREGVSVYLPVFHPGAIFAIGDPHLGMGDGELCGSGGAIGASVTLRFEVFHGITIGRPIVETRESLAFIGNSKTLDEAARIATLDAIRFIIRHSRLSFNEAYVLTSAACDLQVSQLVNPLRTARVIVPKRIFRSLHFPE